MNKKRKKGVLYSTDPNFEYEYEGEEMETLANNEQKLRIHIDKHRAGKIVVIIKGFIGSTEDLKSLAKNIKIKCGVGGSVKNGEILIQGDVRDKVIEILQSLQYNTKRIGG
ncbi:MAG: translation initiation factor [Flavobacteriales bacterium]|nr:translation initiation factor [Flavobacteriales bacterium]|tara:strand:+ start:280 stop:612 length:333 start_codon:yes stop_codon:yes gene_type:complete